MDLLIDDIRDFNVDVIARNGHAGRVMLSATPWDIVYFDHDLGDDINGYELLTWALENDILNETKVKIVTGNPVGRQNMEAALENANFIEVHPSPYESYWEKT